MQKLISKIGVVTRGSEHQILAQLIQVLYLVAVGAICVEVHLADSRAGVRKLVARASGIVIPQHVARGDLDANTIFRQLERLRFRNYLLQQHGGFAFQLRLLFSLLLWVRRGLRSCRRLAGCFLGET